MIWSWTTTNISTSANFALLKFYSECSTISKWGLKRWGSLSLPLSNLGIWFHPRKGRTWGCLICFCPMLQKLHSSQVWLKGLSLQSLIPPLPMEQKLYSNCCSIRRPQWSMSKIAFWVEVPCWRTQTEKPRRCQPTSHPQPMTTYGVRMSLQENLPPPSSSAVVLGFYPE